MMSFLLLLSSCGVKEYLITSGNENLQALTKITDNSDQKALSVATSPTSSTIFFTLFDGTSSNIFKKDNPTSASMSQITSGDVYCLGPAYNPATDRLAFTYSTREGSSNWTTNDIYTLGFNNVNALSPVTQTSVSEYRPSFTPDGAVICYQSKSGREGEIWTKNIKSNETTLLGSGMQPIISPDGGKIVFCRYKNNTANSPSSIWVMNIDGTDVTEVISNPNQRMFCPSWSPDGTRIVFQAATKKGKRYNSPDIYMMNTDGSGLTQLTTNDSYDDNPMWGSDGYIYFISDRGGKKGNYQVWRFKAN